MTRSQRLRWQATALMTVTALAVAACSQQQLEFNPELEQQLELGPDRVRARHHPDHDHDRQPPAAHRPGGAGVLRDRSRVGRVLRLRERARRRLRAQHRLQVPQRRVRPDHDGVGGAPARTAGQRLRDLQRARHAHAPGRGQLPELEQGSRPVRRVRMHVLEPADASTPTRSATSWITCARGRSSGSTWPSTSRTRRSATSTRTTSSAWTA